jgi:hypothetical protein
MHALAPAVRGSFDTKAGQAFRFSVAGLPLVTTLSLPSMRSIRGSSIVGLQRADHRPDCSADRQPVDSQSPTGPCTAGMTSGPCACSAPRLTSCRLRCAGRVDVSARKDASMVVSGICKVAAPRRRSPKRRSLPAGKVKPPCSTPVAPADPVHVGLRRRQR